MDIVPMQCHTAVSNQRCPNEPERFPGGASCVLGRQLRHGKGGRGMPTGKAIACAPIGSSLVGEELEPLGEGDRGQYPIHTLARLARCQRPCGQKGEVALMRKEPSTGRIQQTSLGQARKRERENAAQKQNQAHHLAAL